MVQYGERPHMSLDWDNLETSVQAFAKKMPKHGTAVIDEQTGEKYHVEQGGNYFRDTTRLIHTKKDTRRKHYSHIFKTLTITHFIVLNTNYIVLDSHLSSIVFDESIVSVYKTDTLHMDCVKI